MSANSQASRKSEAIDQQVKQEYRPNPLETIDAFRSRKLLELETEIDEYRAWVDRGMGVFLRSRGGPRVQKIFERLTPAINEQIEDVNQGKHEFTNPTIVQMAGLSDEEFIYLLDLASERVERRNFEDASAMFEVLSLLHPASHLVWMGMGCAESGLQRFQRAREAFEIALLQSEKKPPLVYVYAIQNEIRAGDKERAQELLAEGLAKCAEQNAAGIEKQLRALSF